jgi:hypothetical protein
MCGWSLLAWLIEGCAFGGMGLQLGDSWLVAGIRAVAIVAVSVPSSMLLAQRPAAPADSPEADQQVIAA